MRSIDPRYYVTLKGRPYPVFAGVLDAATKAGLKSLTTKLVQIPTADNGFMAIVKARAEFEDGRVFEDYGDASPANCSPRIATAAIRMASTRGKGRVLRDGINLGETLREELPDLAQVEDAAPAVPPASVNGNGKPAVGCVECGVVLRPAQVTLSEKSWGKAICPTCQRAVFA